MRKIVTKILRVLLIILFVIPLFYCSDKEDIILAKVGNSEIKSSDYMKRLKKVRTKLSLPDNGAVRMNFLKTYIDEKLLLEEAAKLGYDSDAAAAEKLQSIRLQKLLDLYLKKEVYDPIQVTNDDLKRYFAKMNIKLKVRHLYADNKKTADSLYTLVTQGTSFEKLAREVFNDPRLKETGGDLGYMGVDDMQMDFADAAYKLEIGQISIPVKTNYGYSIIRVDDRRGNPLLTETEFLKQKSAILESYSKYALKRAAKDHAAQLENNVKIDEQIFDKLYKQYKPQLSANDIIEPVGQTDGVPDEAIFLSSDMGTWDVKTFKDKARFTSEGQRNWIQNKDAFREFVLGLVAREQVVRQAQEKDYDELDEYKDAVEKEFNEYQIERLKQDIMGTIETPDDSLTHFYQANKSGFFESAKVALKEIILSDPQTVAKVKALLVAGKSFDDLARKYSLNKNTSVYGGDMGFISYNELGPYSEKVKNLKPGEWTGPLKKGPVIFFLKCTKQQPARLISFEEAKDEIATKYKMMKFDKALQDRIDQIRSYTHVAAYPKKLRDLKYN